MRPKLDLDAGVIHCATCLKEVGPACRTRAVTHLRGLLTLKETKPDHFDLDDAEPLDSCSDEIHSDGGCLISQCPANL